MTERADSIIIGGGVMGASIAYHLAQQKAGRVILLERHALANGTTGRSGAIVRQHYSNDFTIRMAKESLHVFEHFDDVIGGDCGFVTTGMIVLVGPSGIEALQANVTMQREQGVDTRIIRPEEIKEVAPGYSSTEVAVACYEPDAGIADPMATTYCFAQRARDLGAIIHEGTTVTRILTQAERVVGVETTQGIFEAPIVVLVANVWSPMLAEAIGIILPIKATRHPMLILRRPQDFGGRHGMHAVCLDLTRNIYLRPDIGGVTLVGSTEDVLTSSDPDNYMQSLTADEINFFRLAVSKSLPALARSVPRGSWAGLYDDTPDYHPIVGRLPHYDGLYSAVGFSGHGFKLSPTIGQWMAQLILTGNTPDDMKHFAFDRFARGKEIHPRYSSGVLG